jgi:hypothetical protein
VLFFNINRVFKHHVVITVLNSLKPDIRLFFYFISYVTENILLLRYQDTRALCSSENVLLFVVRID